MFILSSFDDWSKLLDKNIFSSTIVKKGNKTVQNIKIWSFVPFVSVLETNVGATSWLIDGVDFTSPSSFPVDSSLNDGL